MSEKKELTNLQKVAAAKNFFSSVCFIDTACFDECFLFHMSTRSHLFFIKVYCNTEVFSNATVTLFGRSFLRKVRIYVISAIIVQC